MVIFKEDISYGLENVKVSFLNDINNLEISKLITYTANCVLGSESCTEEFESVSLPCDCEKNCSPACLCLKTNSFIDGKLDSNYSTENDKLIIECSSLCSCDMDCANRLTQQGIRFSLQVFMTTSKGFGVRTLEFIPKSSFVCEYAGEIIDAQEAERRWKTHKFDSANYIYVLKEHSSKESCTQTVIDPTFIGNVGRYLNHCCSPNLISVPVRANSMVPRICFFAKLDIDPNEELTYDYGGDSMAVEDCSLSSSNQNDLKYARKCLCNSSTCVRFLPFDSNLLS